MGKSSSSSARRTPLLFLYLAASLALHAGHEEETFVPQIEKGETSFTLADHDVALELKENKGSFLLEILPFTPSLIGEEWVTKKGRSYEGKKGTRFTQGIKVEEELSPTPFISTGRKEEKAYDPNIEEKRRKKTSFPKTFKVEKWNASPSPLFSFDPPAGKGELIQKKNHFQKGKGREEPYLEYPQHSHHLAHVEELVNEEELAYHPTVEKAECPIMAIEDSPFYPDEPFANSPMDAFPLENPLDREMKRDPFSSQKETFRKNPSFATTTFETLHWANDKEFSEDWLAAEWRPSYEEGVEHWSFGLEISSIDVGEPSVSLPFKEEILSLDVPCSKILPPSKSQPPFKQREFEHIPYIYIEHQEADDERIAYSPEKEGVFPEPIRYSVSAGPSVAMEMEGDVFSLTPAPSFDLFTSEDGITPPKKLQKFVASSLEVSRPYFSNDAFEALASQVPSPRLEPSQLPEFQQSTPEVNATLETSPSNFDFHNEEEHLSLIGSRIEFPESQGLSKQVSMEIEEAPYISTFHGKEEGVNTFLPTAEPLSIPFSISTPSFTLHSSKGEIPFALSQPFERVERTPFEVQGTSGEHSLLSAQGLSVPNVKEKGITPKKGGSSPYDKIPLSTTTDREVKEVFPAAESQEERVLETQLPEVAIAQSGKASIPFDEAALSHFELKGEDKNFNKELLNRSLANIQIPLMGVAIAMGERGNDEGFIPPSPIPYDGKAALHEPVHPAFYPPEVPHLAMDNSVPSMAQQNLEYTKKVLEEERSLDLALPYLGTKRVSPKKEVVIPKKAFEDLPAVEVLTETVILDKQFPNTRALLEKGQVPSRIPTDLQVTAHQIQKVETDMIRSQSKEILEDYDHENGASSGMIALEHHELSKGVSEEKARLVNQSKRFTQAFLTEIPPPAYLETVTYANEFDTEVHYSKRDDGKGYLFALKIKPKPSLHFSSPHQNFIYVIDGSSSIKKHRFNVFKEGVNRSLSFMKEGDSFNILVADAEVIPMSKQSVEWNGRNEQQARKFLEKSNYRGFFINYDPFDLLEKVTQYLDPEKDNVIVLISDGKGFKNFKAHKEDFQELAEANKGRFSIFTATASNDNNLSMLDLLSAFNGGELMYSKTHSAFSRQLARMVRHVEHLIAKDIHVHVIDKKLETGIDFYPNQESLPSLYSDKAYTIYGTIDQLKDFDLILQGRCGDQWINIKQHISFMHAEKASSKVKRGFALQKAYVCYDYYLKKEDPFFLNEAERILNPLTIPTATR